MKSLKHMLRPSRSIFSCIAILGLISLLVACHNGRSEQLIQVEPVSQQEARALAFSLQTGQPVESLLADSDLCASPVEGMTVSGKVTVPEDYENPSGTQIQVFYYGRLQQGQTPVVFYNGGPSSDSHGSAQLLERQINVGRQSFIYIDQRGTGCSDPYPTDASSETVERLTHYGSTEIVRDSEVIREKILGGNRKWKVFGQSYGGLITHRYALVAPLSVAAAFSHGFSLMKDQTQWLKLRIHSQKRVSELYFKSYPGDRTKLAHLRASIPEDLCFSDGGTKVCGAKVTDALTIFLGFSNSWGSLHWSIGSMLSKDGKLNMAGLEKFVRAYVFGVYNHNGLAASVISQVEISNGGSDLNSCETVEKLLEADGEAPRQWPVNECRLLMGMENNQWSDLLKGVQSHLTMAPEQLQIALTAHPELAFYLYSGEKDVFVPFETFQEEVQLLGRRITYRQFPASGHEGFYTENDLWQDLLKIH